MGLKKFDYKIKDNSKKKSIMTVSIIALVLFIGLTISGTLAKYKETKSYNIIKGVVGNFASAFPEGSLAATQGV